LVKSAYFRTPLWRFLLPVMKFDKSIAHLSFITDAIKSVQADGAVLETGVGGGGTSIVINKFMAEESINRPFYAIDTFYGFTKDDVDFERKQRGKTDRYRGYRSNSKDWYTKTLIAHGIHNARVIQADAKQLHYTKFAPVAFCFLDIDLYNPIASVLPRLHDVLAPGGMIVVVDCNPADSPYDGAGQAYREFCASRGIAAEIVHDNLGIIRKRGS
jgi:SAM-dependent methyltransferase